MTGRRKSTITACAFVLAGACTTAEGAWHVSPVNATVVAQVVAACRIQVPASLSSMTMPATDVVVHCTREVPHSIRVVSTPDVQRDTRTWPRPVPHVLVSF